MRISRGSGFCQYDKVRALLRVRGLALPRGDDDDVRRPVVDLNPVASLLLGAIAGGIRAPHRVLERGVAVGDAGNADAGGHRKAAIVPGEDGQLERPAQPFGDIDGVVRRALRQDQAEFVTAEPGHQIMRPPLLLQEARDLAEQAVAGEVAAAVVDVS